MSKKEAAQYLGIKVTTLDRFRKADGLPYLKMGGLVKFEKDSLDAYIRMKIKRDGK